MKRAFSLIELMIAVAIIGIIAAIVVPTFQANLTEAKEAAAKDNLRILRTAIELYAAKHGGIPPGYSNNDTSRSPTTLVFTIHLINGRYLTKIPANSFNRLTTIRTLMNGQVLPQDATGAYGWIYQAQTKSIKLDWPGTDKTGTRYYDY